MNGQRQLSTPITPTVARTRSGSFRETDGDLRTTEMGSQAVARCSQNIGPQRKIGGLLSHTAICGNRRQYRAIEGNRRLMAESCGDSSNLDLVDFDDLFQALSDWEHQLKYAEIDIREVQS